MSDARVARENVELVTFTKVDARIARSSVEAVTKFQVDARIGRSNVEVLVSEAILSIEGWGAVPI